jgi:hypothetical protein
MMQNRDPAYWRAQAAEARAAAADMTDPKAKRTLEKIAASYEMLARRAEKSQETASPHYAAHVKGLVQPADLM